MTLRPRGQLLTLVVLAALAVVGAVFAVVAKVVTAAWLAGVVALVAGAGAVWARGRDQRAADRGVVRRALTGAMTVGAADLRMLRAHPAVEHIPYLPRAAKEREVADLLRAGTPVVLVGASMVGKTRLAAQVVKSLYADRPLLLPDSGTSLTDLDKANVLPSGHVVWLDDLERFLAGGLTPGLVRRLAEANTVVATLRAKEWDRLQPADSLRPREWEVLQAFHRVTLDRDRDRPSDEAVAAAVPDVEERERLVRIGVGEYVGAVHHIRNQLELGCDTNPLGYSMVLGAVDWYRAGMVRAVPADALDRLARAHLDARRRHDLADPGLRAEALKWATREINPRVSLLEPDEGGYALYDYALDFLSATDRPVPDDVWDLVVEQATPAECALVGFVAFTFERRLPAAEAAFRKASETGNPWIMYNLGVTLSTKDPDEALQWYQRAADLGLIIALHNGGMLLLARGEVAGAQEWFLRAAESGDTRGLHNLGVYYAQDDDLDAAEGWFRRAAELGEPESIPVLAELLHSRDRSDEAIPWYRKAVDIGHTAHSLRLGLLLVHRGLDEEAEPLLRAAAEAGDDAEAAYNYGVYLREHSDASGAEHWFRLAAEAGHSAAMAGLAILLFDQADQSSFQEWLVKAAQAGNPGAMTLIDMLRVDPTA